jgi:hypothetical protein
MMTAMPCGCVGRRGLLAAALACAPASAPLAQEAMRLDSATTCGFFPSVRQGGQVFAFSASNRARAAVQRVADAVNLRADFDIRAAAGDGSNLPFAMAGLVGGRKVILYSETWVQQIQASAEAEWASLAVLAPLHNGWAAPHQRTTRKLDYCFLPNP